MSCIRSLIGLPLRGVMVAILLISLVQTISGIPYDQKWTMDLCVNNYGAGAQVQEGYTRAEHIDALSQISAISYGQGGCPPVLPDGNRTSLLEARFRSDVIGEARIGWASANPIPDAFGRHQLTGRSLDRLAGIFSVDEFLRLWPDASAGDVSIDWLPCA